MDCYEKRMFYGDSGPVPTGPERCVSAPAAQSQPTADLFSFDDNSTSTAPPAVSTYSFDSGGASAQTGGFDAFDSPSPATPVTGTFGGSGGFDFSVFESNSPVRTHSAPPSSDPFACNSLPTPPPVTPHTGPSFPPRVTMDDIDPFSKPSSAPPAPSNVPIGQYASAPIGGGTSSIGSSMSSLSIKGSSPGGSAGGFDVFGTDVLQPSGTGLSGSAAPRPAMVGNMHTSPVRSTGAGMAHNPHAAAAISSLGMSPQAPPSARPSSGAFDFVGGVMQSELGGRGNAATGPGIGMGSPAPQVGIGMMQQQRPQGMMGGGGMSAMGGSGSFGISGMGALGGPPPQMGRGMGGGMSSNSGAASFPSDWGK